MFFWGGWNISNGSRGISISLRHNWLMLSISHHFVSFFFAVDALVKFSTFAAAVFVIIVMFMVLSLCM